MKKILDIAIKDMTQSFRSKIALVFMFVVPILMTGMFYLMFGGMGSAEQEEFTLPTTKVQIVNLDQGSFPTGLVSADEAAQANSLGEVLVMTLAADELNDILEVTTADDPSAARKGVDAQEFGVAIIIPENFTEAMIDPDTDTTLEMYRDPTLTLGPSIIQSIIEQFLDNFSSSKITMFVTVEQLEQSGFTLDQNLIQNIVAQFTNQIDNSGENTSDYQPSALMDIRTPEGEQFSNDASNMIALMMAGMTVFYVFYTGASTGQSILTEDEKGTLARLFTTPTQQSVIFAGKFLAIALTIIVQISVLLLFGSLVFQIDWGNPIGLLILTVGLVFAAATFGIFLISWVKTARQAGFAIGGLVTLTGMMGMLPVFVANIPNPPELVYTLSRLVPQGWGTHGLQALMNGGDVANVFPNFLILLAWSAAFFVIGVLRFRNRFA